MKNSIITLTAVLGAASAQAAVTITSSVNATTATASVSTDLLQTTNTTNSFPANATGVIVNGTTGVFDSNTAPDSAVVVGPGTYDINLDLGANPAGYDISQIDSYTGWRDNRAGQSYTISFSTVAAPTVFTQITLGGTGNNAVSVAASGESLVTNVFESTGALLGTGVAVIRFDLGANGNNNVWREIDVFGIATPVPEPSSLALLGFAGLSLTLRRRRV